MNLNFLWILVVFAVLISVSNARPLKHYKRENKLNSKWARHTKDHNVQHQLNPLTGADSSAAPVLTEKKLSRRNAHRSDYKSPHHKEKYQNKIDEQFSQQLNGANSKINGMQDDELVEDSRSEGSKKLTSAKREALNDGFELSEIDRDADERALRDSADLKFVDAGFADDDDSSYNLKAISKEKVYNTNGKVAQSGDRVYRDAHSARKRFERVSDPYLGLEGGYSDDINANAELNRPYDRGYSNTDLESAIAADNESLDSYGELRLDPQKSWKK